MRDTVDLARILFGADAAFAAVIDQDTGGLILDTVSGDGVWHPAQGQLPVDAGIAGWVVSSGHAVLANGTGSTTEFPSEPVSRAGYVPGRVMAAPLVRDGHCLGVIEVLGPGGPVNDPRDLDLLVLLADQAAQRLPSR
ncbi:GAF domain-containing protein [Plantactinospora sp. S1510]|uniref:GAF domain-containing protein n=1 Tax=Plantactinospora alkalitolerans TaxID=2789879 RepID=A0ABS0GZ94_9ACTN|nr:GAF domain-containing protein [Plantactinospora alkalitolerans]MBF9131538.1 GAF domain-containing protein [Plantactinospora alkalitolerans]